MDLIATELTTLFLSATGLPMRMKISRRDIRSIKMKSARYGKILRCFLSLYLILVWDFSMMASHSSKDRTSWTSRSEYFSGSLLKQNR